MQPAPTKKQSLGDLLGGSAIILDELMGSDSRSVSVTFRELWERNFSSILGSSRSKSDGDPGNARSLQVNRIRRWPHSHSRTMYIKRSTLHP